MGLATLTFAMGGISAWMPTFLHRFAGMSVANASLTVGAITVIDGIAGTLMGGWIAQIWLRTNHRALYLLSFWSVAADAAVRRDAVLRAARVGRSVAVCGGVLSLPEYRAAEYGDRELGFGAGAGHGDLDQPVLHSLLRRHVFAADYWRHQRPNRT